MDTDNDRPLAEDDEYWSNKDLCRIIGIHRNTSYHWLHTDPTFPRPLAVGSLTRWKASEVRAWLDSRQRLFGEDHE